MWMHQLIDSLPVLNCVFEVPDQNVNIKFSGNYGGTNGDRCTHTLVDLLINLHHTPKTSQSGLLNGQNRTPKIGHE